MFSGIAFAIQNTSEFVVNSWEINSSGNLVPTSDNAKDIGSSTYEIKDLYVDGVAYIDALGEAVSLTGNLTITGNLISSATTYTIGTSTTTAFGNIYSRGELHIDAIQSLGTAEGDNDLTIDAGKVQLTGGTDFEVVSGTIAITEGSLYIPNGNINSTGTVSISGTVYIESASLDLISSGINLRGGTFYQFDGSGNQLINTSNGNVAIKNGDLTIGDSGTSKDLILYDVNASTQPYKIEVIDGVLTATKL